MSHEPEYLDAYQPAGEADDVMDLETAKSDFITYLDGKIAPLFATESLSYLLGSEPTAQVDPSQIADLVDFWAQMRSVNQGKPVHELYLKSVEIIVTADHTGVIAGFKPSAFYLSYFEALAAKCPPEERDQFLEKLKQLREMLVKQWSYDFRRENQMHTVKLKAEGMERKDPVVELRSIINRLKSEGYCLTRQDEQEIITHLKRVIDVLARKTGFAIMPNLEALIGIAIERFNSGNIPFSAELLYIVYQTYNWSGFDSKSREWLRSCKLASELNTGQFKTLVGKSDLKNYLQIFIDHFEDLNPTNLLSALSNEKDRQNRRLLTSLVEAHGESVAPLIMNMLSKFSPQSTNEKNWYFPRNLIYLLGRVAPRDHSSQNGAISLISPYLRSPIFQLRIAAISSLENFTIDEALQLLLRVFSGKNYTEPELKNRERILTYLNTAINLIGKLNNQAAVHVLVEIACGRLIDFIPERLVRSLRLQALQALINKREQLSPALVSPIIERIRSMTKWKIKILSLLFREDEEQLFAMLDVVAAAPSREGLQLLIDIRTRYDGKPLGRHASDLLNNVDEPEIASPASAFSHR
jgi:hypothetical protein